jgi:hypothetical protein
MGAQPSGQRGFFHLAGGEPKHIRAAVSGGILRPAKRRIEQSRVSHTRATAMLG